MADPVGISKSEIMAELERILSGSHFRKSPILSKFLRFVVEGSLEGRENQIKEYSVGVAVLQKPVDFNPQTDASVRIAAIRLRKLLDEFYLDSSKETGVRIQIPKGSYSPIFTKGRQAEESYIPQREDAQKAMPADSICLVPFTAHIYDPSIAFSAEGFTAYLSEKLSLFQDIQVKGFSSVVAYLGAGGKVEKLGTALKVTYYLSGSIEIEAHHTLVSVHLFDAASNTLIWSQNFTPGSNTDSLTATMEEITSRIVASLGGYSGLLHYKKFSTDPGNIQAMSNSQAYAVFWFYHFQTKLSESIYREALQQLTKVTDENSDCDLCWALLAHLYVHSIVYHYKTDTDNPLQKAQGYLARAFSLNPESHQGHITLAWISVFLKDKDTALNALEKAEQLNPNSSYGKAVCSLGMSFIGEYDRATQLLEKAILLNPLPFWWVNLPIIFKALLANDHQRVLFYARKIGTPAGIHEHIFEMIALWYLGETATLRHILALYLEEYPGGIEHAQTAWSRILFDNNLVKKISLALDEIKELNVSANA